MTHPSRLPRWLGWALVLITFAAWLPAAWQGFILYDDPEYISQNRIVQAGLTAPGIRWAFGSFHGSLWIPLTWLSHMLDCEWFGADPAASHLVNALLHALNAFLLFRLLLGWTLSPWASTAAAALWAWHPLRVESVAWAAERKDVLSGLFLLLTLLAYDRFVRERAVARAGGAAPGRPWYLLALFCCACGLMSKPALVTLPFGLLLLDYWPWGRWEKARVGRLVLEKVPFLALSVVASLITTWAARDEAVGAAHYGLPDRVANALAGWLAYAGKILVPWNLALIYPLPARPPWGEAAGGLGVLVLLCGFAWAGRKRRPWWLVGVLWFFGTLVPTSGLVQVGTQAFADRFTYLPFLGLAFGAAAEGAAWARRPGGPGRAVAAGAGVLLAALLGLAERQLRYWDSDEALFGHALAVNPANPAAHANLGVALERAGHPAEARRHYEQAISLMPNLAQIHNNLARLDEQAGQTNEALGEFDQALKYRPRDPVIRLNHGSLLLRLGRGAEAMTEFTEAARLAPADPRPLCQLGKAALRQGRHAEAAAWFQRALGLDPGDLASLVFLARLRATDSDAALRDGAAALRLAVRAYDLTGGGQPAVLEVLAVALAETGRFGEAQVMMSKAADQANAVGDTGAAARLRREAEVVGGRRPFRSGADGEVRGEE